MMTQCDQIDSALKLLDREIWIVTAAVGTLRGALTATWVSPVSIDRQRPMLLAGLAPNHHTAQVVAAGGTFVAHLLRPDQWQLAFELAALTGHEVDKLRGIETRIGATGGPILTNCAAWFECRVFARYDAGDRVFFWGDVIEGAKQSEGPVLREQAFFGHLSSEQKARLLKGLGEDVDLQRPLHQQWREIASRGTSIATLNP